MSRRRSRQNGGLAPLFGLLLIVAAVIKFIWWIIGAIAIVIAFFIVRAIIRNNNAQAEARRRADAGIAARADQQHDWVLRGDDRGIYGPEGAKTHALHRRRNFRGDCTLHTTAANDVWAARSVRNPLRLNHL